MFKRMSFRIANHKVMFDLAHCLADFITLLLSVKLLWKVQLPRRQRRMILVLFIASRFLCIFSLAHSIAQLVAGQDLQAILAHLQVRSRSHLSASMG